MRIYLRIYMRIYLRIPMSIYLRVYIRIHIHHLLIYYCDITHFDISNYIAPRYKCQSQTAIYRKYNYRSSRYFIFSARYQAKRNDTHRSRKIFQIFLRLSYVTAGRIRSASNPPYALCEIIILPPWAVRICLTMSSPRPWRCSSVFSTQTI